MLPFLLLLLFCFVSLLLSLFKLAPVRELWVYAYNSHHFVFLTEYSRILEEGKLYGTVDWWNGGEVIGWFSDPSVLWLVPFFALSSSHKLIYTVASLFSVLVAFFFFVVLPSRFCGTRWVFASFPLFLYTSAGWMVGGDTVGHALPLSFVFASFVLSKTSTNKKFLIWTLFCISVLLNPSFLILVFLFVLGNLRRIFDFRGAVLFVLTVVFVFLVFFLIPSALGVSSHVRYVDIAGALFGERERFFATFAPKLVLTFALNPVLFLSLLFSLKDIFLFSVFVLYVLWHLGVSFALNSLFVSKFWAVWAFGGIFASLQRVRKKVLAVLVISNWVLITFAVLTFDLRYEWRKVCGLVPSGATVLAETEPLSFEPYFELTALLRSCEKELEIFGTLWMHPPSVIFVTPFIFEGERFFLITDVEKYKDFLGRRKVEFVVCTSSLCSQATSVVCRRILRKNIVLVSERRFEVFRCR